MKTFVIDTFQGVVVVGAKNKIGAAMIIAKDPVLRDIFIPIGEDKLDIYETTKYITEIPCVSDKSGIIFEYSNNFINVLK